MRHCLAVFGAPVVAEDADVWTLDPEKASLCPARLLSPVDVLHKLTNMARQVCHHLAVHLLEEHHTWPLADFMQRWREAAPEACPLNCL